MLWQRHLITVPSVDQILIISQISINIDKLFISLQVSVILLRLNQPKK